MACLLRLTWPSRSLWVGVWQTSSTPLYFSYLLDIQISVVFHCVEHLATATAIKTLMGRCVGKARSRVRFDLYDNHVFNIFTGGSVTLFSWPIKLIRRKYYNKVNSSKCRIKVKPHSKVWIENTAATSNKDKENNNCLKVARERSGTLGTGQSCFAQLECWRHVIRCQIRKKIHNNTKAIVDVFVRDFEKLYRRRTLRRNTSSLPFYVNMKLAYS